MRGEISRPPEVTKEDDPDDRELRVGAFGIVNYRRFFIGQALSNFGTWFQILAQALLVLKLTGRASALGEATAIQAAPFFCSVRSSDHSSIGSTFDG